MNLFLRCHILMSFGDWEGCWNLCIYEIHCCLEKKILRNIIEVFATSKLYRGQSGFFFQICFLNFYLSSQHIYHPVFKFHKTLHVTVQLLLGIWYVGWSPEAKVIKLAFQISIVTLELDGILRLLSKPDGYFCV